MSVDEHGGRGGAEGAGRFTLDTNVLVYSIDSAAGARHDLAAEIVDRAAEQACWLTLQSIGEFYAAVTRKGIVPRADAAAQANDWLEIFPSIGASIASVRRALDEAASGRASYWDALLVATAAEAGCIAIVTEDLADRATLGGVRVHHPFAVSGGIADPVRRLLGLT
jgi:predicted nucleic acid-binding protein